MYTYIYIYIYIYLFTSLSTSKRVVDYSEKKACTSQSAGQAAGDRKSHLYYTHFAPRSQIFGGFDSIPQLIHLWFSLSLYIYIYIYS